MSLDIHDTIQSQYSDSPVIISLIENTYKVISPQKDFDVFYKNVFDVRTAVGWGLDIWGRLVACNREIVTGEFQNSYIGFEPPKDASNPDLESFNNAPFYSPAVSQTFYLEDNAYRLLVMCKAMTNISTGTLAEINSILKNVLPDHNVAVVKVDTMCLRIVIQDYLSAWQEEAFLRLAVIPAGVGYEVYTLDPKTFGFNGSGLEPFNNGIFSLKGAPINAS